MSHDVERPGGEWSGAAAANAVDESFVDVLGGTVLSELLVATAPESFVVVDDGGSVVFANPAVERIFGYEPEELVDRPLVELIPERLRDAHRAGFGAYLRSGERTLDWDEVRFRGRHRDGHEIPLAMWFREFTHDGDRYFVGVFRDISTQIQRREQLASERAFVGSMFDALPDVVYAFDREGRFVRWNERVNEVTGYTDEEIETLSPLDFIPEDDHERVGSAISRVLEEGSVVTVESAIVTRDGTEIPYEFTGAPLVENGKVVGQTGVGRDISEHRSYEAMLERLDHLNTAIRSVDRVLVEAETRGEITRSVCERLVEAGAYCGAAIGSIDSDGGGFDVDASAGLGRKMVEVAERHAEANVPSIATRAAESGSVEVSEGITSGPMVEGECETDRPRTFAVVPLVADGQRFGLLGLCTDRVPGLSERERAVLGELGEVIGNAIQSALTHQLLYSDTVVEIELRSRDQGVSFFAVSEAADCRLELQRSLSFGDEHVFYFTSNGAPPEQVRAAASSVDSITTVDTLDGGRFEFRTRGGTITSVLSDLGARTTSGVADCGEARIVAELPSDAAVRDVVDAVQEAYPDTELAARHETERSIRSPDEFRRGLAADLTEKQQAALEAAYFAGYFEWPARTSDAGDVAETLDIAPQTFHQHLRVAERKLLSALFEEAGRRQLA
ncbi:PAS domain S-box protein [Halosimplex amylolyticum]|uniref:PAS domain S-box protein n=1 Tax=Halosimplex amylolyticum TaxID=3396616 RepID=UPI003F57EC27